MFARIHPVSSEDGSRPADLPQRIADSRANAYLWSMGTKVFVNLPVKDLQKSMAFFSKLGFTFDPRFTNQDAACMVVGQESFVMLLVERFYKTFTSKQIADASRSSETILAISAESRDKVDELVRKALAAGAEAFRDPEDQGFMYGWSFQDLDGHLWEVFHMDEPAPAKQ